MTRGSAQPPPVARSDDLDLRWTVRNRLSKFRVPKFAATGKPAWRLTAGNRRHSGRDSHGRRVPMLTCTVTLVAAGVVGLAGPADLTRNPPHDSHGFRAHHEQLRLVRDPKKNSGRLIIGRIHHSIIN